jgi:energy-coupling factor transport system substrate-specific component
MNKQLSIKRIAVIALLAALLTIGRLAFAMIPNVQPNTIILMIASFVLGPLQGLLLAILSTATTNLFLGHGIWSIGQMVAWGIIAVISGFLGRFRQHIPWWTLVCIAGLFGMLFGFIMSIILGGIMIQNFWAYYLSGLPFDLYHAIGNVFFFVVLYKPLLYILEKQLDTSPKKQVT